MAVRLQMKPDPGSELVVRAGLTVRVRHPEMVARLLLMIHGWGGDENVMWIFAGGLPSDTLVVSPRAPHAVTPSGYSWWPSGSKQGEQSQYSSLLPAASDLSGLMSSYADEAGLPSGRWTVMGFSQGAALASLIAAEYPASVKRLALLAGFVPRGWHGAVAGRPLEGMPVFIAHGTEDQRVEIERGRRSRELLESAGARVQYCEDPVGHKVSARCLRAVQDFLRA